MALLAVAYLNEFKDAQNVRMADGCVVSLLQVRDGGHDRAWGPAGQFQPPIKIKKSIPCFPVLAPKDGDLSLVFVVHSPTRQPGNDLISLQPTVKQIDPKSFDRYPSLTSPQPMVKDSWFVDRVVSKPSDGKPFSVSISVADSAWKTVDTAEFGKDGSPSENDFLGKKTGSHRNGFPFYFQQGWRNLDWRVVAFHPNGHYDFGLVSSTESYSGPIPRDRPVHYASFCQFLNPSQDFTRVEIQTREFHTAQFEHIEAAPASHPVQQKGAPTSLCEH